MALARRDHAEEQSWRPYICIRYGRPHYLCGRYPGLNSVQRPEATACQLPMWKTSLCWIPSQGAVLCPILFNIYMAKIPRLPQFANIITNADGCSTLSSGTDIHRACYRTSKSVVYIFRPQIPPPHSLHLGQRKLIWDHLCAWTVHTHGSLN